MIYQSLVTPLGLIVSTIGAVFLINKESSLVEAAIQSFKLIEENMT